MRRRDFTTGLLAVAAAVVVTGDARADKPAIFTGVERGVAAGGYDVVAYFSGTAVPGDRAIALEHAGVTWRFASEANRAAFAADPKRYEPRYGGYCAWAVANGYTAEADPEAWSVEGGRLYLNYSKAVRTRWLRDVPGNVTKGDANWPKVLR